MFCNDTFIGTTWKWTKKWLQTWTVKNGYRQPEYLPPTPTSPCGLPGVRQRKTLACESPVYHRVMRVEKTWWLLIVLELSSWVDYSPFFSCMTRSWWDGARWRRGVPWVHNSAWGPKGLDFHPKERKKERKGARRRRVYGDFDPGRLEITINKPTETRTKKGFYILKTRM